MTLNGTPVRVRLDDKRRTTLPPALLAAAGVGPGADLVARVEAPGQIILEAPAAILGRLQDAVRAGKAAHSSNAEADPDVDPDADPVAASGDGSARSLVDQLLTERAADPSLTHHDPDRDLDEDLDGDLATAPAPATPPAAGHSRTPTPTPTQQ